jgi:hypothetical protein
MSWEGDNGESGKGWSVGQEERARMPIGEGENYGENG